MATTFQSKLSNKIFTAISDHKTQRLQNNYENNSWVKRFLNKEKNYNYVNIEGYAPIHLFILEENKEIVEHLTSLDYFKDNFLNKVDERIGMTPITFALLQNQNAVFNVLLEAGAKLDIIGKGNNSLLHIGAIHQNVECVQYGLSFNDINMKNDDVNTALHLACLVNSLPVVDLLMNNNADPRIANNYGFYPIQDACNFGNIHLYHRLKDSWISIKMSGKYEMDLVHFAARNPDSSILKYLVETSPNCVYTRDNGHIGAFPLHYACESNNLPAVRILVENKARVNCTDNLKNTPLHTAVFSNNQDIVEYLFRHGADPLKKNKDEINAVDASIDVGGNIREFFESRDEFADYFKDFKIY